MIRAVSAGLAAAALLGWLLIGRSAVMAQGSEVQDFVCREVGADVQCSWTRLDGATFYRLQWSANDGQTVTGQVTTSGSNTNLTLQNRSASDVLRIAAYVGGAWAAPSEWVMPVPLPTATPTHPPTPTPTSTPGPVLMMRANISIQNTSSQTRSAALVQVPIGFESLRSRGLARSDGNNLLVCAKSVRCWDHFNVPYNADNPRGPVPTTLSGTTYRVYAPQLAAGETVLYDFWVSRVSITRIPASGTPNGDPANYSAAVSGWSTYQPTFNPPDAANRGAFLGPADPDRNFAGVREASTTGLPGAAFLSQIAQGSGTPLRFLWVTITFPIAMIAIAVVQRVFDNIIYSVVAGGIVLVALCSPAVGLATVWVVIFYAILCACVVVIGRRISAGI